MRNFLKYSLVAIATAVAVPAAFADAPAPTNTYMEPAGSIAIPVSQSSINDRTVALYRMPMTSSSQSRTSTAGEPRD